MYDDIVVGNQNMMEAARMFFFSDLDMEEN